MIRILFHILYRFLSINFNVLVYQIFYNVQDINRVLLRSSFSFITVLKNHTNWSFNFIEEFILSYFDEIRKRIYDLINES